MGRRGAQRPGNGLLRFTRSSYSRWTCRKAAAFGSGGEHTGRWEKCNVLGASTCIFLCPEQMTLTRVLSPMCRGER